MSGFKEIQEQSHSIELAQKRLNRVNEQLTEKLGQLEKLDQEWRKEHEEVQKLEGLSLKSVFAKVLGDKEKQLEKERQEYLNAFMKYEEFKKTLEILEFEKNLLEEKVAKADVIQAKMEQLIQLRKKELLENNTPEGKVILDLEHNIRTAHKNRKEVFEAIEFGKLAQDNLLQLQRELKKAKNWGNWDMMKSRSRTASWMKHSAMDKARRMVPETQHALDQFKRELYDVYGRQDFEVTLNLDGLSSFTDLFFDNLITDWIVQRKIQNSMSNVASVHDKVKRTVISLDHEIQKLEETILKMEGRKKQVIIDS